MDDVGKQQIRPSGAQTKGVVLFGGAFNPPHLSHRRILIAALQTLPVERGIVLPSGRHPHKIHSDLAADRARHELCEIAFRNLPSVEISDEDLRPERIAYTVDTVDLIQEQLPGWRLFWLMGSDNLRVLDSWHDHHALMRRATIVTWPRTKHPVDRSQLELQDFTEDEIDGLLEWTLDVPADDVSATEIRAALSKGEAPVDLDPEVARAIRAMNLYGR